MVTAIKVAPGGVRLHHACRGGLRVMWTVIYLGERTVSIISFPSFRLDSAPLLEQLCLHASQTQFQIAPIITRPWREEMAICPHNVRPCDLLMPSGREGH